LGGQAGYPIQWQIHFSTFLLVVCPV